MTQSKQSHKIFQGAINYLRGYFIAYDVKGQVCHNALRASLSGKNRCVALTSDAGIPWKGPVQFLVDGMRPTLSSKLQ